MMRLVLLLGLSLVAPLLGCSSTPDSADGYDHARMAAIERAASATGVRVLWINPPRKAVAAGS